MRSSSNKSSSTWDFAVSTPNYKVLEHFNDFADPWVHDLVDLAPRVDPADGCFAVPDRPGLGLRLNHEVCAAHPRTGTAEGVAINHALGSPSRRTAFRRR